MSSIPSPVTKRLPKSEKMSPEELRAFMDLHGVSIDELSAIFGVSKNAVKYWLNGDRSISVLVSRVIRLFKKYPKVIREF